MSEPSQAVWRALYDTWVQVRDLAPWTWMTETELFGVEDPDTGRTGFVSVMGNLGEHLAVALYLGGTGLNGFFEMQAAEPQMNVEALLMTPQLQASWEDRDQLDKRDRDVIKALGLKFRGRQAWPLFRCYRPCFLPWYVDEAEARLLTVALGQLLNIAPRLKDNRKLLPPLMSGQLLSRVASGKGAARTWADVRRPVPPPESSQLNIPMDGDLLNTVEAMPVRGTIQLDLFLLPRPITESPLDRPMFAHVLMLVDARSGVVLGFDMLHPDPDFNSVLERVPLSLLELLANTGARPRELQVNHMGLAKLVGLLGDELGIAVKQRRHLRQLDQAKAGLLSYMGGGW